jgi:hypothetical protein
VVEWDGLENRCGLSGHRGFESHPLRLGILDFRVDARAMKKRIAFLTAAIGGLVLIAGGVLLIPRILSRSATSIEYQNDEYGYRFILPASWKGYSIIEGSWTGYASGDLGDIPVETGPMISIRHPLWTAEKPRQDIPIMIFTTAQWDSLGREEFFLGAAPIGPSELGRNTRYVFALPARYNYAFPTGWEEVEEILRGNPLQAF